MWCVNNEMLCLSFMTVVFCACIFDKLYCFWLWVSVHGGGGGGRKKGVGGVMHNIY